MTRLLNSALLILLGIVIGGLIQLVSLPPRGHPVSLLPAPTPAPILVHVAGAVERPGVYELPAGSRVRDAIEAADGLEPAARPDAINLAAFVADGEQILVPGSAEIEPDTGSDPGTGRQDGLVNINTASLSVLETLPGIGPAIAQRILDYRQQHGAFAKTADIVKVSGIGPSTFERIKDRITIGP